MRHSLTLLLLRALRFLESNGPSSSWVTRSCMILKRFERAGSAQGFSPSNSSPASKAMIPSFEGYGIKSIHHARKDCDLPPGSPANRSSDREALKDLREPPVELLRAFEQWEVAGMRQHYRVEVSDDAPDCFHIGWKAVAVDAPYGHAQPPRGHSRIVPAESPEHRADGVQRHSGHAPTARLRPETEPYRDAAARAASAPASRGNPAARTNAL